jgi:hypothetical protein
VVLVRTISEERIATNIRVKEISELGTTSAVTPADSFHPDDGGRYFILKCRFLQATQRHIPENGILHIHNRENLKSYIALVG